MFTLNYLTSIILAPYGHKRQTETYILKEKKNQIKSNYHKKNIHHKQIQAITEIC